ncbi:MAG: ABC transporter permease [Microbacterium sp.]
MTLVRYLSGRIVGMIVVLLVIALITFAVFYLLPSDPAQLSCGRPCSTAALARANTFMGTDKPWPLQLAGFLWGIIAGRTFGELQCAAPCFGYSFQRSASVTDLIIERFPLTASVALGAALLWLIIGIIAGVVSALRRGSALDRTIMTVAIAGVSTPVYLAGILAVLVFGFLLRWFPVSGYVPFAVSPWEWFSHLVLPWVTLAFVSAAVYARLTRGELLETMGQDYIRTARAKGLRESRVVTRHGLRTALLPVITVFGLDLGTLLGGTVIIERVFSIPGLGTLLIEGVAGLDLQLIVGLTLFAAFLVVGLNLIVDLFYGVVDPRVRVAR